MKRVRLLLLVGFMLTTAARAALSAHIPQSPINFDEGMIIPPKDPKLVFAGYGGAFAWEAANTRSGMGKTESIKITPKGAKPSLKWEGVQYDLKDIHFHIHSEHTRIGLIYPMEMHIVHEKKGAAENDPKRFLAVGRWILEGNDNKLNPILDNLPPVPALGVTPVPKLPVPAFDLPGLLPPANKRQLFQYDGSLTTGLREEVEGDGKPLVSIVPVSWFFWREPILVPRAQIDKFRAHHQNGNWRETQPLIGAHNLKFGTAVPEPSTVGLLAVGALLAPRRMRERRIRPPRG